MTPSAATENSRPIRFDVLPCAATREGELRELAEHLRRDPPEIPPRYFYDEVGSALFESICDLPEYYQTRTEAAILDRIAAQLVLRTEARELVELGSGDGRKTRILLEALVARGPALYVPFEISETTARRAAAGLVRDLPGLAVHGLVGDFTRSLGRLPEGGRRLVIFLGGTIGNFEPGPARDFLRRLWAVTSPGDFFLLGVDLIKDPARLVAAYDDSAGVTARFNQNVLRVVNCVAGGDFRLEAFEHRAVWVAERHRMEMWLVARSPQRVRLDALDVELAFGAGDEIRTEISTKYDRAVAEELLSAGGFVPVDWFTDPEGLFALALARRP